MCVIAAGNKHTNINYYLPCNILFYCKDFKIYPNYLTILQGFKHFINIHIIETVPGTHFFLGHALVFTAQSYKAQMSVSHSRVYNFRRAFVTLLPPSYLSPSRGARPQLIIFFLQIVKGRVSIYLLHFNYSWFDTFGGGWCVFSETSQEAGPSDHRNIPAGYKSRGQFRTSVYRVVI